MRRLRFFNPILVLILVLLLFVLWASMTHSGLKAIFGTVNRFTPVTINHQGLQGRLANLQVDDLEVVLESSRITVKSLDLNWSPFGLLTNKLVIYALSADQLALEYTAQEPAPSATVFEIDSIKLPFEIEIQSLAIANLDIDDRATVRTLALQLITTDEQWLIQSASADTDYGLIQVTADIAPYDDWQHTLNLELQHERTGPVTLAVRGNRDLTTVMLGAELLASESQLQVSRPLTDAAWQLTGAANDLSLLERTGRISLTGSGDLVSGSLKIDAKIDGIDAQFEQVDYQLDGGTVAVQMNGSVQDVPLSFQGVLDPLHLTDGQLQIGTYRRSPQITVNDARLNISGAWTALALDLRAGGDYQGPIEMHMLGTLNDYKELTITEFDALVLSGAVRGSGRVGLEDSDITAAIESEFSALNLAALDARLPTAVSGLASIALDANGLRGQIRELNAAIRGGQIPISGAADFARSNNTLTSAQLTLQAGESNQVRAALVGDRPVEVTIAIESLGAFVTGASGAARGELQIDQKTLMVAGGVAFEQIEIPGVGSLQRATLEGSGTASDSSLVLRGEGLHFGAQQLATFAMTATGAIDAHQMRIEAQWIGEPQLRLSIDGGLRDRDWRFIVTEAEVSSKEIVARLDAPAAGHIAAVSQQLEPLCLAVQGTGKACASFESSPEASSLMALVSLPAGDTGLENWLAQFGLPRLQFDQGVEMNLELTRRGDTLDRLVLTGSVPRLIVPTPQGEAVEINDILINAEGNSQLVIYSAAVKAAGGTITSTGQLTDMAAPRIEGSLAIDLPDLSSLSALISDLDIQRGTLVSNVRFGGPLARPLVTGSIEIADLLLDLPNLGTRHTGVLNVTFVNSDTGTVTGELRSPSGVASIRGTMEWQPLPAAKMQLTGDNFLFADTAELSVAASPALNLEWKPGSYSLTGSIVIDRAFSSLDLPALQNTVVISKDVVFVNESHGGITDQTDQVTVDVVAEFRQPGKIDGRGISGEVNGRVRVTQQPGKPPVANGILTLNGTYRAFGQVLKLESGQLIYTNTPLDDPVVSAIASRQVDDVIVSVRINGRASALSTSLESTPPMPESDILHYLVLGRAPGSATASESSQLSAAAISLALSRSEAGVQSLGERIGVTDLGITEELGMLALAVGKQLSPRLYVSYTVGLLEPVDVARMRYKLSRHLSLEAEVADESRVGVSYRIEKN